MKKVTKLMMMAVMVLLASSCSNGYDDWREESNNNMGNSTNGNAVSATTGGSSSPAEYIGNYNLTTFSVDFDTSSLSESESIPSDESDDTYEDYIENSDFTSQVKIAYSNGNATVSGDVDGVTIEKDGAKVVVNSSAKKVEYVLSGSSSDGNFKIYSDKKFKLTLNGVSLTNTTGAAINVQSKKRVFVELVSGTSNTLVDGSSYNTTDDEDEKGTFFSEGQLLFSGKGSLDVTGNYKHGIVSDDYIFFRPGINISVTAKAGHAVKSNDGIRMNGGVLNLSVTATACKGFKTDGYVEINGGRANIITTGGGKYDSDDKDVTGSAAIKCDSTFTINNGELNLKSTGAGGKGISSDQNMFFNGGVVRVITTGKKYTYSNYSTSPKGIRSDNNITINGGTLLVRTTGGENSEGIESKNTLTVNDGVVEVYAYDDAINASKNITINGGYVYAYATNNDGIDSNGTLTLAGGVVFSSGTNTPEDGFDCDQNTFTITGGLLLGIGGGTSTPTSNVCKQPVLICGASSLSQGTVISLDSSDGKNILTFTVPRSYQSATILMSSPNMKTGTTYTLSSGVTVKGGTDFCGLVSGGTVSGGSSLASISQSSTVTTYGYSGGMGGGMMGGGMGGRR